MQITDSAPKKVIYISDVKLAAAMITCGIALKSKDPIERIVNDGKPQCFFYMEDPEGKAEDYMLAWESKEDFFSAKKQGHPLNDFEHPFWYMRAALRNRERLIDASKNSKIIHMKTSRGKTYLITVNPNEQRR